jgi:DNA-binding NtrC family response regulator
MVHWSSVFHTIEENYETLERFGEKSSPLDSETAVRRAQTVLLATNDSEIRQGMTELLRGYGMNTLLASGMEEIKSALAKRNISACFCGFWLVDGTFRDIVRHMRRQRDEIPVIVVCAPSCPDEYQRYLGALNIRAFDFISHPYRRSDVERILDSTVAPRNKLVQMPTKGVDCLDGSLGPSQLHRAS